MPVADDLEGKTLVEVANIKATAFRDALYTVLIGPQGLSYPLSGGRTVTIEAVTFGQFIGGGVIPRLDGGADALWVRLKVDGQYPNDDGWYGFLNPPIMVPDGQGGYVENLLLAAKAIITEAIEAT